MIFSRILQVIPLLSGSWGGTARVAADVSRELTQRGHKVTIYTSDLSDFQKFEPIRESLRENGNGNLEIRRFRTINRKNARYWKFFVSNGIDEFLKQKISDFDIVHLHDYRTFQNIVVHYYSRKFNVPYIVQAHGAIPRIGTRHRLMWLYDACFGFSLLRDAKKAIALSEAEVQQYRNMGVLDHNIEILPNGIYLNDYVDLPPCGFFKKNFDIPSNKKIILYLGAIRKTKGIAFLIEAYAHLIKNIKLADTLLVIAGPDDGYLDEAKSLAGSLEIADNVKFTGLLEGQNKRCVFADSTIVVSPMSVEAFGLVALEAAASSKPVIVSNNTPMAEIVKKGKFGFSVEYGAVVELAETMHKMLINDSLLSQMGLEGRKFVFENFSWSKIVPKLEEIYTHSVSCCKR